MIESIKNYLPASINLIDVGCKNASFIKSLLKNNISRNKSIGIDPLKYPDIDKKYTKYYQCAIYNGPECIKLFNEYESRGCSSLLDVSIENITSNPKLSNEKWLCSSNTAKLKKQHQVRCIPLSQVIEENIDILPIHYIKIDAQGSDSNVAKSLGKFVSETWFIQTESASCYNNPNIKLYYGQPSIKDDIKILDDLGFRLLFFAEHLKNTESNLLFGNKEIMEKIKIYNN